MTCSAARRADAHALPDLSSPRADLDVARQALDAGQALDVQRGSTCRPHALPDRSSPRAGLDALARRSTRARRSTCSEARRADLTRSRTAAHPVRAWTRSPGARRGPGARRAARLDVQTSRAPGPQLTPCGLGRALGPQLAPCGPGRARQALARRSTCSAARRADNEIIAHPVPRAGGIGAQPAQPATKLLAGKASRRVSAVSIRNPGNLRTKLLDVSIRLNWSEGHTAVRSAGERVSCTVRGRGRHPVVWTRHTAARDSRHERSAGGRVSQGSRGVVVSA